MKTTWFTSRFGHRMRLSALMALFMTVPMADTILVADMIVIPRVPVWAAGKEGPVKDYPWLKSAAYESIESRIAPPPGFKRLPVEKGSFGAWLSCLPLKPGSHLVLLYNGRPKRNQSAHYVVLDVDVGNTDLQQCADALIRLRAEYLRSRGYDDSIAFHFTSGDLASWPKWRDGERPKVLGNKVSWYKSAVKDTSYANLRKYLDVVFTTRGPCVCRKSLRQ